MHVNSDVIVCVHVHVYTLMWFWERWCGCAHITWCNSGGHTSHAVLGGRCQVINAGREFESDLLFSHTTLSVKPHDA